MKVEVIHCDWEQCESHGAHYEVQFPEGKLKIDLCETHSTSLRELREVLEHQFTPVGQKPKRRMVLQDHLLR